MLSLDHISVEGPATEFERRGFRITPTEGGEGRHARIMLDRGYLELRAAPEGTPIRGTAWFLRSSDEVALHERMLTAGFAVSELVPFTGIDGSWVDLELPGPAPVTPIVTRRIDLDDWPPALPIVHPNGAERLAGVRIRAQHPEVLLELLRAAGATVSELGHVLLAGGEVVVIERGANALLAVVLAGGPEGEQVVTLADGAD